jgi:hypothetical protein
LTERVTPPTRPQLPAVVAIEMGYGHVRPAQSVAEYLNTEMLIVDHPSMADDEERRLWARPRNFYEWVSRISQLGIVGPPLRWVLDTTTSIPHLHPYRDLSAPHAGVRGLQRLIRRGLGRGLVAYLKERRVPLLTTFYAIAIAADAAGCDRVFLVVTDSDVNRVWVPAEPGRSAIEYFVPSQRTRRRLMAYGVPPGKIHFTGFPLPDSLVGGPELGILKRNLATRLVRLDPEGQFRDMHREELGNSLGPLPEGEEGKPPLLTFAVGGAGAQVLLAERFLPSLKESLSAGKLRLALVAGSRPDVADQFRVLLTKAGLADRIGHGVELLLEPELANYLRAFNDLLARTDILWTKPSELTFFGALGIPLVMSWPVGVHERYNRRWALEAGAGLKQRDPSFAAEWIGEWLSDGTLAAAAWSGFMFMPKFGLYRIAEALGFGPGSRAVPAVPESRAG